MGSAQNKRNGLDRVGDGAEGYPDQYIVIGVDITAEALKARFKGTKRETYVCAIIDAAWQAQRTKKPPTRAFVELLRGGVEVPIIVSDLGRDGTLDAWEEVDGKRKRCGKNWVVVIEGRQRVLGRRILDAENKPKGIAKLKITCVYRVFGNKATALEATIVRCVTAGRVARTPSARAEDAAALRRSGMGLEDIAPLAEARDATEVEHLLCLDKCETEVKDAVDEGKILLAECKILATKSPEEQVRLVLRKTAVEPGTGRTKDAQKARNAAAAPAQKARPRKYGEALAITAETTTAVTYTGADVAMLVRYLLGDGDVLHDKGVSDHARALIASVEAKVKGPAIGASVANDVAGGAPQAIAAE